MDSEAVSDRHRDQGDDDAMDFIGEVETRKRIHDSDVGQHDEHETPGNQPFRLLPPSMEEPLGQSLLTRQVAGEEGFDMPPEQLLTMLALPYQIGDSLVEIGIEEVAFRAFDDPTEMTAKACDRGTIVLTEAYFP